MCSRSKRSDRGCRHHRARLLGRVLGGRPQSTRYPTRCHPILLRNSRALRWPAAMGRDWWRRFANPLLLLCHKTVEFSKTDGKKSNDFNTGANA
jgi:hypothetical protein